MNHKKMMMFGMSFLVVALLSNQFLPESLDGVKGLFMGLSIGCNLVSVRLKCLAH